MSVLLVEDAHYLYTNEQIEPYYTTPLGALGFSYSTYIVSANNDDGPSNETMSAYDAVIWFTGNDYGSSLFPTFTAADRLEIKKYLDSGGRILITGQDIGFDISATIDQSGLNLYESYFHSALCVRSSYDYLVEGTSEDPLGSEILLNIGGGLYNQLYPSLILPYFSTSGSEARPGKIYISDWDTVPKMSFYYANYLEQDYLLCQEKQFYNATTSEAKITGAAALRSDTGGPDGYKIVYFAFGLEGIEEPFARKSVLNRTLNYLLPPITRFAYVSPSKSCDPADSFCERAEYPVLSATCTDSELFSKINASEYFVDSTGAHGTGYNMSALDGAFDNATETVNATLNVTLMTNGLHNIYTHCKDKSLYWGKYANASIEVDRTLPVNPGLFFYESYVNYESALIYLKHDFISSGFKPDYVSFSCNQTNWTLWVFWGSLLDYGTEYKIYPGFNLTGASAGCSASDGNRTVYVRSKDAAGNVQQAPATPVNYNWIVLDRQSPWHTLNRANNTCIRPQDNFSIMAYDGLSGVNTEHLYYKSDTILKLFQNNTPFNPGWTGNGLKYFTTYIHDIAGNNNQTIYLFILDSIAPSVATISPPNASYILDSTNITINFSDVNPVTGTYNNGTGNFSVSSGQPFNPGWSGNGWRPLDVWAEDCAGNILHKNYSYFVDTTPPSVDAAYPENSSNVTLSTLVNINASDSGSGIGTASSLFNNGTGANASFYIGDWFSPNWVAGDEGLVNLFIWISDLAGNILEKIYSHILDVNPPATTDNYTLSGWNALGQSVNLSCTDTTTSCDTTLYCIHKNTEPECMPGTSGSMAEVSCSVGDECRKYVRYFSNDTVGHTEAVNSSLIIMIDRKAPSISVQSPEEGKKYAGIVDIYTTIADSGSGVLNNNATYSILNASNSTQTIEAGSLNLSGGWRASWNSTAHASGSFILSISALDNTTNYEEKNVSFSTDNDLPSASIIYPKKEYLNESFSLDLKAVKVSSNLSLCAYKIYNSSGTVVEEINSTVNHTECSFNTSITIDSWSDGNYTLNFSASDELSQWDNETTWFYLDRASPQALFTSPANGTIATSYTNINFSIFDETSLDACAWRYKSNTSLWSIDFSLACSSEGILFDTSLCQDSSVADCIIQLKGTDSAGNTAENTTYLLADNSPPVAAFLSPAAGAWKNANFTVTTNMSDIHTGLSNCSYSVIGSASSGLLPFSCSLDELDISVDDFCQAEGYYSCYVYIFAENAANLTSENTRNFSIDLNAPSIQEIIPENNSIVSAGTQFTVVFSDNYGIQSATYDNGTSNISLSSGQAFGHGWSGDGGRSLEIHLTDFAGNRIYRNYSYTLDTSGPSSSNYSTNLTLDSLYGDFRIYPNETVVFSAEIYDPSQVLDVAATISSPSGESNITLSPQNSNYTNDTWTATITDIADGGSYNVSALYLQDMLGNKKTVVAAEIGTSFIAALPSFSAKLGNDNESEAGSAEPLNMTYVFNKTVSSPAITVYIPPNTEESSGLSPNYSFTENITCLFFNSSNACNVVETKNADNKTYILNITSSGIGTSLSITSGSVSSATPANDTVFSWAAKYGITSQSSTLVRVPRINATNISCSKTPCVFDQNESFTLTAYSENINSSTSSASAISVYLALYPPEGYADSGIAIQQNLTAYVGNISSGNVSLPASWNISVSDAGTYEFDFGSYETHTRAYASDNHTLTVQIKDIENPLLIKNESKSPKIISVNSSFSYTAIASDNEGVEAVLLEVEDSSGNMTNTTFSLQSGSTAYGTWNAEYLNTSKEGRYNITGIYINDSTGNMIFSNPLDYFETKIMYASGSITPQNASATDTFTFSVNVTKNVSAVTSVKAAVTKPRGQNESVDMSLSGTISSGGEQVYIYTANYTNSSQSGTYNVSFNVSASGSVFSSGSFEVQKGNLSIYPAHGNQEALAIPVAIAAANITWFLIPEYGDVFDVNTSIAITNESVANLSFGETKDKQSADIYLEDAYPGKNVFWQMDLVCEGTTNITVNSTDSEGNDYYSTITLYVAGLDSQAPQVTSVSSDLNISNLGDTIHFEVNATDNSIINYSVIELSYPNSTKANYTLSQEGYERYIFDYPAIPSIGNYTYSVYFSDLSGNINSSVDAGNLTAYDVYHVSVSPEHSIYNKGEYVIAQITVLDVNSRPVSNYSANASIVKGTEPIEPIFSGQYRNTAEYEIEAYDPPDPDDISEIYEYVVYVNASFSGNFGSNSSSFNVSKTHVVEYITPGNLDSYPTGQTVPLRIRIKGVRGDAITGAAALAYCASCDSKYTTLNPSGDGEYVNLNAYISPTPIPGQTLFSITTYTVDLPKNTQGKPELSTLVLSLSSLTPPPPQNQVASGGGGGKSDTKPVEETVTQNETQQEQLFSDFEIEIDKSEIPITQGLTAIVAGSIKNKGTKNLSLVSEFFVEPAGCCDVNISPSFSLEPKFETAFSAKIHIPLSVPAGEKSVLLRIRGDGIKKEKSITVLVKANEVVEKIEELNKSVEELRQRLISYRQGGLIVIALEERTRVVEAFLQQAQSAVLADDAEDLSFAVSQAEKEILSIEASLFWMDVKKYAFENKELILACFIFLLVIFYILNYFALPYADVNRRLISFKKQEKVLSEARKSAEKQYFTRKIDEPTFRNIMAKDQASILKIRGEIKRLEEERKLLLRFNLDEYDKYVKMAQTAKESNEKQKVIASPTAKYSPGKKLMELTGRHKNWISKIVSALPKKEQIEPAEITKEEVPVQQEVAETEKEENVAEAGSFEPEDITFTPEEPAVSEVQEEETAPGVTDEKEESTEETLERELKHIDDVLEKVKDIKNTKKHG